MSSTDLVTTKSKVLGETSSPSASLFGLLSNWSSDVIRAWLLIVGPDPVTRAVTSSVATFEPAALLRLPMFQMPVPDCYVDEPEAEALTNVKPLGSRSVIRKPVAGIGPLFVAVTRYVTVSSRFGAALPEVNVLVTAISS